MWLYGVSLSVVFHIYLLSGSNFFFVVIIFNISLNKNYHIFFSYEQLTAQLTGIRPHQECWCSGTNLANTILTLQWPYFRWIILRSIHIVLQLIQYDGQWTGASNLVVSILLQLSCMVWGHICIDCDDLHITPKHKLFNASVNVLTVILAIPPGPILMIDVFVLLNVLTPIEYRQEGAGNVVYSIHICSSVVFVHRLHVI